MKPLKPSVVLSVLLLSLPAPAEILERVVAKVNGDIITLSDFTARQIAAAQQARIRPEQVESFLRDNNARILQEAIDDLLLVQRAADIGLRLRPEYIREVVEGIKKENRIESEEAFLAQLRQEGMSLDDLKRNIERSILRNQVLAREVESKASVSEAQLRAEYEAKSAQYSRPESVELQEIRLEGDGALARARELVRRARAGEDFAALARAHSSAPTRDAGGALGRLARGEMNAAVEAVAFALEPGGVSEPIASGESYQILRVVSRTPGGRVPFEEVKDQIAQEMSQAERAASYDKLLKDLRTNAILDIRVREVPLQVDLPSSGALLDPVPDAPRGGAPAQPAPAARPADEPEFVTTPQARPERVPAPAPPSPSPTPPPLP